MRWQINGITLPRNPDTVQWPLGKGNVTYVPVLNGSLRRLSLARKFSARDVKLAWHATDARTRAAIWAAVGGADQKFTITLPDLQPARSLNMYFDEETQHQFTADIVELRPGHGGVRRDIEIAGKSEPYFVSTNTVPVDTAPDPNYVAASFGGPYGDNRLDYLPSWDGSGWNKIYTAAGNMQFSNLGTAPWPAAVRINGPFTSCTLTELYFDADGTGQGVSFLWTGSPVASGDYILFDTDTSTVLQSIGGTLTQVYTFALVLPGSQNLPYADWPLPPAGEFVVAASFTGADGSTTSVDYSNNGTEQFRYF